jgi:hypothetical protein
MGVVLTYLEPGKAVEEVSDGPAHCDGHACIVLADHVLAGLPIITDNGAQATEHQSVLLKQHSLSPTS